MDKIDNVNHLLELVDSICQKYDAVAKSTGNNFNIFQTLDLQSDELSHSRIIAELLNPEGSHGMKDEFLKLFLNKIEEISDQTLNYKSQELKNTVIETEKTTEKGRVDIVITMNQAKIIIENKIYAGDQEKQLKRYREVFGKEATIVYLTLDGSEPSGYSTGGDKNTYDILMSYKDIIELLVQYKEKAVNFPYLRETIAQYTNLLNTLTGQSGRKDMSDEIVEVAVKNQGNVKAAFAIAENVNAIREKIVLEHFVPAMEEFAKEHKLDIEYAEKIDCLVSKPFWGISFINGDLLKLNICIRFEFQKNNLRDLIYGFNHYRTENVQITEKIKKDFSAKGFESSKIWPCYKYLYLHWLGEQLADLVSKDSEIIKNCKERINDLLGYVDSFQKGE